MQTDLCIVGAGPAGLSHAFWQLKADPTRQLMVFDRQAQPGGWVRTQRSEGFSCEVGPQSLRPGDQSDALIEALGIEDQVVAGDPSAKLRYFGRDGRLIPLPSGPKDLLKSKLFGFGGKLRLLSEAFRGANVQADESLAEFMRRRFGKQTVPLAEAMASGVFGGDAHALELAAAFPKLHEWEQEHGSILKGVGKSMKGSSRPAMCSFRGGMTTLVQALRRAVEPHLQLGRGVTGLQREADGWKVLLEHGEVRCREVVLAVPAHAAAKLLAKVDSELSRDLAEITYASIANVYLGFWRNDVEKQLRGFGFLLDRKEQTPFLGAIYCSSVFPDANAEGRFLVRMMAGGVRHPEYLHETVQNPDKVCDEAEAVLRRYTGLEAPVIFKRVISATDAIPQFNKGHKDRVQRIRTRLAQLAGLGLAGNSYLDVSVVAQLQPAVLSS